MNKNPFFEGFESFDFKINSNPYCPKSQNRDWKEWQLGWYSSYCESKSIDVIQAEQHLKKVGMMHCH